MTDDEITEQLFVCENPVPADIAIMFGADNERDMERRARRGVELYRAGLVPRLLVTGGGALARTCPESTRMAEFARRLGVPDVDLLVEDQSTNTFENAAYTVALLQERGLLNTLAVAILISAEWHMRRVLLTVRRFFPATVRFVCCPTREGCNRENWMKLDACREQVALEALLMETFRKTGAI